jgi:hypothetical protein
MSYCDVVGYIVDGETICEDCANKRDLDTDENNDEITAIFESNEGIFLCADCFSDFMENRKTPDEKCDKSMVYLLTSQFEYMNDIERKIVAFYDLDTNEVREDLDDLSDFMPVYLEDIENWKETLKENNLIALSEYPDLSECETLKERLEMVKNCEVNC